MVVGMSLYSQIREAYISGESQRSISKRLGVSRPTVKRTAGDPQCPVSERNIFALRVLSV